MSAERQPLTELAQSVADGAPIDWGRAEEAAAPDQRRVVRQLCLVSSVAALYRSLPAEADAAHAGLMAEREGPRWGHLVLLEVIGRGMSGEVHRAWDLDLQREVALKLFPPEPKTPRGPSHVLSEARRLARVRHPNVAAVFGADRDLDRVGFWMELVQGPSLQDLLDRDGPFSARETALIGIELCGALAAVHRAGLLHRDVKAQNVLRETGGRIVLTDFGTGEEAGATLARMAGTPMYLAPEILAGKPASVQSDLYSLGVLLFHLVTREFPIEARTMPELVRAHRAGAARHLRDLRPDLNAAFVQVVERLLAVDPAARFQTAGALESALRASLAHGVTTEASPPAGAQGSPGRTRARNPGLFVAAAILTLAVLGLLAWLAGAWRVGAPGGPDPAVSVAVLPLVDLTNGAGPPHLAEALTDQLTSSLGQLHGLRVASGTSVKALGATGQPVADIAGRLGVSSLVEGTVAVADGPAGGPLRVRVNARLIAAGTNTQLWSGSFERALGDTFALQADVAREIARHVRVTVSPAEAARLDRQHKTIPDAEAAYFEGRHHLNHYGAARAAQALRAFQRAVELDRNYPAAHVGIARSYIRLGFDGGITQAEARSRALGMVTRAVELDDDSAEAHTAAADLMFFYDWNWQGAERSYARALELNRSSSEALQQFARHLAAVGRLDRAIEQAHRATDLDPLSAEAAQTYALMLYFARRHDEAAGVLQHAFELNPNSAGSHVILSRVREAQQRYGEALEEANRALALAEHPGVRAHAARQMALAGDDAGARAELEKVSQGGLRTRADNRAYALLALGDTDPALALLEQAESERDPGILWLAVDPRTDALRSHPRFVALLERMGLPSSLDLRQGRQ